jgi:flavodoxin short chain
MKKIAVVFWSGTGNTENMANTIVDGVKANGGEATLFNASEFSADLVSTFDGIAFGCPAMGSEELEDTEFLPMFTACEPNLKDKNIALFGSYGWGDGEWIRLWADTCTNDGANLVCDSVICSGEPTPETDDQLVELAKALL